MKSDKAIEQTKKWIKDVIVAHNICPFAAKPVKEDTVYYAVEDTADLASALEAFMLECNRLDMVPTIETSFIIFTNSFEDFDDYLDFLALAETLIEEHAYDGVYQVASFHPKYKFEGSNELDAANYTNRSPYPMLHIIREESLEKAIALHPNTEEIPQRNIEFARGKGLKYMKLLRDSCMD
jgi:hypothetical protein